MGQCYLKPTQNYFIKSGILGLVAGWGYTLADGEVSATLKSITMPVVNFQQCLDESADFKLFVTPDKFCGGFLNGTGVCQG